MLTESDIIHTLKTHFPEQIGDDAACIPLNQTESYVISKDLLVEDTHFRLRYQDAKSLAHKALHVNLSDLAAMGARPQFVLLGLSIPKHFEAQTAAFLEAFSAACRKASVILIGGDTTRSTQQLLISITAIGIAKTKEIKFRKNTNPGDLLCVAGHIGAAHLGFTALEHEQPQFLTYKHHFLTPNARLTEGAWLAKQKAITSMMDISDGLFIDLERLCDASNVACDLNLDSLTPGTEFTAACEALSLDSVTTQLTGGEDYALMLSITADAYPSITEQFKHQFKYDLRCIGQFKIGQGITLIENNKQITRNIKPFLHFE